MNNGRRTSIDGVNGSKSSFTPKLRRSRSGNSSSTNNIKNMTKFALSTPILLRSASIGMATGRGRGDPPRAPPRRGFSNPSPAPHPVYGGAWWGNPLLIASFRFFFNIYVCVCVCVCVCV